MWTHTFVCLKTRNALIPLSAQERALLQITGLGEKRILTPLLMIFTKN